jgi:mRNA interferase MazF
MKKYFNKWNKIKKSIDLLQNRPSAYKDGDVWWANIGCNVGVENNGKGDRFLRPVLVLRKINKYSCFIVPISTKIKYGDFYYLLFIKGFRRCLLLNQIKVIDSARLVRHFGQIKNKKLQKVKDKFIEIL